MRVPRAVLGAVMLAGACGDPAVDGTYEGEARFELQGLVCALGKMDAPNTAVGVIWTTLADDATRRDSLAGETRAINTRALPADFEMRLFEPPPFSTAIRSEIGVLDIAIGIPVLFDDLDGDGALAVDREPVLGASRGQLVLYAEQAPAGVTSDVALTADRVPSGWSVGQAVCDPAQALVGLEVVPTDTRFDVWLFPGLIDNPLESLAPTTCLMPL